MIDVIFPFWPPSVNHGWRHVGNRTLLAAPARDFRREIEKSVIVFRRQKKLPLETILGDISVELILYPPDRKKRDLDNYFKAPLDAMTHSKVWKDDSQVKKLADEWGEPTKGGGFRLIVKPFVKERS